VTAADADGSARSAAGGGGPAPRAVPWREDPRAVGEAEAACSPRAEARWSDASVRRLRTAPPVQLELVSAGGPGPEVVWASLPERCREAVLVLLARLIDSGAVEQEDAA